MKTASGTILGLSVSDAAIVCAEVTARAGKSVVRKLALLPLDAETSLVKPAALGEKLAAFLAAQNITASKAVVGVPARWTISSEKELPPADSVQLHALLRLQGERMASADSGEMAYDYAGSLQSNNGGRALLVAMRKTQLDAIEQMVSVARLSLIQVLPWSLALAATETGGGPTIFITRGGAEVVLPGSNAPRLLRHVALPLNGSGLPSLTPLGSDLKRTLAMSSVAAGGEAMVFDGVGFSPAQLDEFADRAGLKRRAIDPLSRLGVSSETMPPAGDPLGRYAPAIALALAGLQSNPQLVNFTDSKLAPPPEARFGRRTMIAAVAGFLVVATLAALWINNRLLSSELAVLQGERKRIEADVTTAQAIQDRVNISTSFLKNRTPMLECLRQITQNFRLEDPIWIDAVTIKEDDAVKATAGKLTGRLEGRTTDPRLATELFDRIKADRGHFRDARVRDLAGASGKQKDQSSFSGEFFYSVTPTPEVK